MKKTDIVSCKGSTAKGVAKLGGFVLLSVVSLGVYGLFRLFRYRDPFMLALCFHRFLVKLCGFRVRVHGQMAAPDGAPVFFVSNHSSYLDIPILGSIIPGSFVAKAEVNDWPFIGMMARLQNTVFVERRAVRVKTQSNGLRQKLEEGVNLILFPEGTSSDGHRTLPFKSSLFSVVETPLPDGRWARIQPVSIVATEISGLPMGRAWRPYYAWYGDMTFVKHVWAFFKIGAFTVDIVFHPPVTFEDFGSRKLLAAYCQQAVTKGVDQCVTGRFEKELAPRA